MPDKPPVVTLDPILVSIADAAAALGLTPWSIHQLLREKKIESRYHGKRRLVVVDSLHDYAASLPTTRPAPEPEAS